MTIRRYKPTEMCEVCGSKCCKEIPGTLYPEQVRPLSATTIAEMLRTGQWSIDCWEGDVIPDGGLGHVKYLRPATMTGRNTHFDRSWGGVCVFLGHNSCKLPWDNRPLGCQMLKPGPAPGMCCIPGVEEPKKHGALAWRPHQALLREALMIAEDSEICPACELGE